MLDLTKLKMGDEVYSYNGMDVVEFRVVCVDLKAGRVCLLNHGGKVFIPETLDRLYHSEAEIVVGPDDKGPLAVRRGLELLRRQGGK
jgi:hypothetical protein